MKIMDGEAVGIGLNGLFYIFAGRIIGNDHFHLLVVLFQDGFQTADNIVRLFISGNTNTNEWFRHDQDGNKYN